MIYHYQILPAAALPAPTIRTILNLWQVDTWKAMDAKAFRKEFSRSEFHLLTDAPGGALQCIARINHAFTLKMGEEQYTFAELVGLVAAQQGRGSGTILMERLCHNLRARNVQALGFCSRALRPFYEKCGVSILHDRARYIYEPAGAAWVPSGDDDILDINLSPESAARLRALNEHNIAYFVP